MLLGVDVWEGALDINEEILLAAGVKYINIRLNHISGINHKDENFDNQWAQAEPFLRAPYYVYSPWYTGKTNAEWLMDNIPKKGVTRKFADIEVKKDGYSPDVYAHEVRIFKDELGKWEVRPTVCYTGQWFLPYLSYWPDDWEYWWARYPWLLYPDIKTVITWEALRLKIDAVGWKPDPYKKCPGAVAMWQCTADRYIPPGCAGRPMDMNVMLKTPAEGAAWWGVDTIPVPLTLEQRVSILEREALKYGWDLTA